MSNIIPLLDAYESARATADCINLNRGLCPDADAAYEIALGDEEAAVEAAITELCRLEPEQTYGTARAQIALPYYRSRIRAQYAGAHD